MNGKVIHTTRAVVFLVGAGISAYSIGAHRGIMFMLTGVEIVLALFFSLAFLVEAGNALNAYNKPDDDHLEVVLKSGVHYRGKEIRISPDGLTLALLEGDAYHIIQIVNVTWIVVVENGRTRSLTVKDFMKMQRKDVR